MPSLFKDDLPLRPLALAIHEQIRLLKSQTHSSDPLIFGERKIPKTTYLTALNEFALFIEGAAPLPDAQGKILGYLKDHFEFYEVYGRAQWGEVFLTSYFEPVIDASLTKTPTKTVPLYRKPRDLVELDLAQFDAKFSAERKMRGRLEGHKFLPYYTREEIDVQGALKGKKLEICYVDPLDSYLLQVQGSGTVVFPDGKRLFVNYADKNGFPYESISKFFRDKIPTEQLNLHTIEAALRAMPRKERQALLNKNPSYVFFTTERDKSAITSLGVSATDGRTIATDGRYFVKGALAYLEFDKPVFESASDLQPKAWEAAGRLVLDQDIGGAITGPGRVDLFWGRGPEAKQRAGVIKREARLSYLLPRL